MNELYLVQYCHPRCLPLRSITRLSEAEACAMAQKLSSQNSGTAFGRFADFQNYYPKRLRTEKWLYDWFIKLGGEPATEHPLYFVVNGSDYLDDWFDKGRIIKLPLGRIRSEHVSFTFGDSMARMDSPERKDPFTKETLQHLMEAQPGGMDSFFRDIEKQYAYIEAQLWDDSYLSFRL